MFENEIKLGLDGICLKPLHENDCDQLATLAADKRIWEYSPKAFDSPLVFKNRWFNKAIAEMQAKKRLTFSVFMNDQITGSSSYYEIDSNNKKLNIGYTWFHPSFWGTKINVVTKLLMIGYAIETLSFNRVGFSIDSTNKRAWNALEKMQLT